MIDHDYVGPSRKQFAQEQMKKSPRFNLFVKSHSLEQNAFGVASEMAGILIDTASSGNSMYLAIGRAVDTITSTRESIMRTSGMDLATATYAVTLFSVGYLGYAVVDFLTKKSNFNNTVEAATYSEYGSGN